MINKKGYDIFLNVRSSRPKIIIKVTELDDIRSLTSSRGQITIYNMIRDYKAEQEMLEISKEIWAWFKTDKEFPRIESKQGGSTGAYYPAEHMVRFRWNSWNKMPEAGKRMIAIHELYHAAGFDHKGMFCHAFDILTLQIYKIIWGQDRHYKEVVAEMNNIALETACHPSLQ